MRSGRLRHNVLIEHQVHTQDPATGADLLAWATFKASVPAEVLTGPGREFRESGAGQAEVTARINMRWFSGLLPTMRITWRGVVYNIRSIETDATGRAEYRVACTGGVNAGAQ